VGGIEDRQGGRAGTSARRGRVAERARSGVPEHGLRHQARRRAGRGQHVRRPDVVERDSIVRVREGPVRPRHGRELDRVVGSRDRRHDERYGLPRRPAAAAHAHDLARRVAALVRRHGGGKDVQPAGARLLLEAEHGPARPHHVSTGFSDEIRGAHRRLAVDVRGCRLTTTGPLGPRHRSGGQQDQHGAQPRDRERSRWPLLHSSERQSGSVACSRRHHWHCSTLPVQDGLGAER